tara:strand:+ start:860 stop:1525 length:666 start_codon:yes stop_codon:yes gene_type:complete
MGIILNKIRINSTIENDNDEETEGRITRLGIPIVDEYGTAMDNIMIATEYKNTKLNDLTRELNHLRIEWRKFQNKNKIKLQNNNNNNLKKKDMNYKNRVKRKQDELTTLINELSDMENSLEYASEVKNIKRNMNCFSNCFGVSSSSIYPINTLQDLQLQQEHQEEQEEEMDRIETRQNLHNMISTRDLHIRNESRRIMNQQRRHNTIMRQVMRNGNNINYR